MIIRSTATTPSEISPAGLNAPGPLRLSNGDEYHFMFVRNIPPVSGWQLIANPVTVIQARDIRNAILPVLIRPVTRVEFAPANWIPQLTLPPNQLPGSRVVISQGAGNNVNVIFAGQSVSIPQGDLVSFRANDAGQWQRETITIDLLMAYADIARQQVETAVIQAKNVETFGVINDALENTGANFRLRLVGLRELAQPAGWTSDNIILGSLRTHPTINAWRNELRADAVNYMNLGGPNCGLAFVNTVPSDFNMVATEDLNCTGIVHRHEFGHNMGIHHGGTTPNPIWARGDTLTRTIMGGNDVPFFSTPLRFQQSTGLAYGTNNSIDATRMMNANAPVVADFRSKDSPMKRSLSLKIILKKVPVLLMLMLGGYIV